MDDIEEKELTKEEIIKANFEQWKSLKRNLPKFAEFIEERQNRILKREVEMTKSFQNANMKNICQKCGKKNPEFTKNIGLNCQEIETFSFDFKDIFQFTSEDAENKFEEQIAKLSDYWIFYCRPPKMVHLCLDCYHELIKWFGIPELDAIDVPKDMA